MNKDKRIRLDTCFFYIGIVAFIIVSCVYFYMVKHNVFNNNELFHCVIKDTTGVACPGCGGTRAVIELSKGNIAGCFYNHPSVLFGISEFIVFMIIYIYRNFLKKNHKEISINKFIYAFLAVTFIQWIFKIIIGY